jgi:hypothetical protein
MFTGVVRSEVWDQVQTRGVRTFTTFLTPDPFTQAASLAGRRIVPSPLNPVNLVLLSRLLKRITGRLVPLRPGRHYPRPNGTKIKDNGRGKMRLPSKTVA